MVCAGAHQEQVEGERLPAREWRRRAGGAGARQSAVRLLEAVLC